jgi:acetyl-CoA carboxylase carboxyl transferase subunit alpha
MELHGDRTYGDDPAILGGIATWHGLTSAAPAKGKSTHKVGTLKSSISSPQSIPVMILGHQKGRTTKQKMERNFGMARPEGYRKAMRLMTLAERAQMPLITLIDTPGAFPGLEAEQRGQSQAIAESIHLMFNLKIPVISIVIGEGGSGGALALGVANRVLMQEYSTYSVISPESCASILWSDSSLAEQASDKLKMNPKELVQFGIIDQIIHEPKGGSHRDWKNAAESIRVALQQHLESLMTIWHHNPEQLMTDRIQKFRAMGQGALAHAPI